MFLLYVVSTQMLFYLTGYHQLLSDELSEVSDNLKLTVQFLSDDFAAVSELSGKNLR